MTGLKAFISKEEFDALPETIELARDKAFTPTEGGGYRLVAQAAEGYAVEDVAGLRKTLEDRKERQSRTQAELDTLKEKFGDLDPVAAREALERPVTDPKPDIEKHVKAATEKLEAEYQKKLKLAETKSGAYRTQLEQQMIDAEAASVLAKDGTRGSYSLLKHAVRDRVQVEEDESGKLNIVVLGADNKPMYASRGDAVEPARIEDLVKSFREDNDLARAFDGTNASGGGVTGAGRSVSGNQTRSSNSDLSPVEKLKAYYESTAS